MTETYMPNAAFVNIRNVDPSLVPDIQERKAVYAMLATTMIGQPEFDSVNQELMDAARVMGVAPTMTYEDLVFANPLERGGYVLSEDAAVAEQEILFYVAHRKIESDLAIVIDGLRSGNYYVATALMNAAGEKMGDLYRQLSPEAFAAFRPYFVGINGYPGPSGLFTAAVPIIDLMTHGGEDNISASERVRLIQDVQRGLYPSHQTELLQQLLLSANPRLGLPPNILKDLRSLLNTFRGRHKKNVHRFAKEALEEGAEGSGGVSDVAAYLGSKLVRQERGGE